MTIQDIIVTSAVGAIIVLPAVLKEYITIKYFPHRLIGKNGFTQLMFYAKQGQLQNLQEHLKSNVDSIDAKDRYGRAACNGQTDTATSLITSGADASLTENERMTAAEMAIKRGHHETAEAIRLCQTI